MTILFNSMNSNPMNYLMNQSLMGENGIIINQIINLITNISFNRNDKLKSILNLFCIIPKIAIILCTKHIVNHTDKLSSLMYKTIRKLLYRKEEHVISNSDGLGSYINHILNKTGTDSWSSMRFLINNDVHTVVLYTLRLIPISANYRKLINQAKSDKNAKLNISANYRKLVPRDKTIFSKNISPNKMFPSKNYIHLTDMVNQGIKISEQLEYYQIIPILINGEPGLGKSKSLDYLAFNSKIKDIVKVDLTNYINTEIKLETILNSALPNITGHTVVMIDELDKYISSICGADESPEKVNDVLLNHVLNLIESDSTSSFCVYIIFCSNNFDTIFDYIPEDKKVHYESLKNRFLKLVFYRMDKDEFREYVYWFIKQTKLDIDVDRLINDLPDDFSITQRDLRNECLTRLYNIPDICKNIKSSPKFTIKPVEDKSIIVPEPKSNVKTIVVSNVKTTAVSNIKTAAIPNIKTAAIPNVKTTDTTTSFTTPNAVGRTSRFDPQTGLLENPVTELDLKYQASLEQKYQKSKDESIAEFGENPFPGYYWRLFYEYEFSILNKGEQQHKFLQFILNHPNCGEEHRLMKASFFYYEDIVIKMISRGISGAKTYVDIINDICDDNDIDYVLRAVTPGIIAEMKKYKTLFANDIYFLANQFVISHQILKQFDDPTTIPIIDYFNLPIMQKINNTEIAENVDKLHELLQYSYTYNHELYKIGILYEIIGKNQNNVAITPVQKQIISNFLNKIEQGKPS